MPEDPERMARLEARVRQLERQLAEMQPARPPTRLSPPQDDEPPAARPSFRRMPVPPGSPPHHPPAPHVPHAPPTLPAAAAPAAQPAWSQPDHAPPGPRPRRDVDLGKLLGANWLARAGVLVLALGIVFFLKLAYDRGWVPIPGRYAIGLAVGAMLAVGGDLLRRRRIDPVFTQILAAGGFVIAYVTVYLGYVLPDYRAALGMTLPLVLALLAAASAATAGYAVWRNLPALAGVAAGLSLLVLAPAGEFSTAGAYYVGLLCIALLAAAAWRRWDTVILVALGGGNVALLGALGVEVDWRHVLPIAVALNGAALTAAARAKLRSPRTLDIAGALAAASLFVQGAVGLVRADVDDPMGWSALAVGLSCLAVAAAYGRLGRSLGAAGGILLLAWPTLHFPLELAHPLAYAGLAAAAGAVALLAPRRSAWRPWAGLGATLAVAAGAGSLFATAMRMDGVAGDPWAFGGLAFTLAAEAAAGWLVGLGRMPARPGAPQGQPAEDWSLLALAAMAALLAGWPFVQFPDTLAQTTLLAVAAAGFALLVRLAVPQARHAASVAALLMGVAVASLLAMALGFGAARAEPLWAGLLALAVAATGLGAWTSSRPGAPFSDQAAGVASAGAAGILVLAWPFLQFPDTPWQTITLALAGLSLGALALRLPAQRLGLEGLAAAAGLTGILSLGVRTGAADGPVEVSLCVGAATAIAALGVLLWGGRRAEPAAPARVAGIAVAALAPAVHLLMLLDGWQVGVAWAAEAVALAALGLALRDEQVRIASFAAFAVVLGRVFLVDLQQLELPFRVLTFILVGSLLLLGAFLYARQRRAVEGAEAAAPPQGPQ